MTVLLRRCVIYADVVVAIELSGGGGGGCGWLWLWLRLRFQAFERDGGELTLTVDVCERVESARLLNPFLSVFPLCGKRSI